jgi:Mn-dependent DtxR family transcriptional regulator
MERKMTNSIFIKADEIAEELGVSKPYAYKLVKRMNEELRERGFVTIPGRVSRQYYREKVYGVQVSESTPQEDQGVM